MSRANHYKTLPSPRVIENPTKVWKRDFGKTPCRYHVRNSGSRGQRNHGNVSEMKSTTLPNFTELIDTTRDNVGRRLVEI